MTDQCCGCHEHQVAFVAKISLAELDEKRKQTLSKLNNISGRICSLWFFQTSLKKLLQKTPQNRKKNSCGFSSLSLHASSSTPNTWHSPIQLKDTSLQVCTPQIDDLAFDGSQTNNCLDFSPANLIHDSAPKITQRRSNLQQNASTSIELPKLGISLDDSQFSWTSSLATPPTYTAEGALLDEDETGLQEQMTKAKTFARALFSPDKEQSSLDGVLQLSTNISNAFKNCDKTPLAANTQKALSPNIPFSPVLFESKDECTILPKHEAEKCHNKPLSISSSSSSSSDLLTTICDRKVQQDMSSGSVDTPVSRPKSDCQLHSILSKKKHFSSTPKHVHFSELPPLGSRCDKDPKTSSSANKLRQLRESSSGLSDLTLVTMQSQCFNHSTSQKTIGVNTNLSNVENDEEANWKEDTFQRAASQPHNSTSSSSFVETPLSVILKKDHDDNLHGCSSSLAAPQRTRDTGVHKSHPNSNCKTDPQSPHGSKDKSSIHPGFVQSLEIKPNFVDSSENVSSIVPSISLNCNSRSLNSSGYVSAVPSTNENHNANSKSLSYERLSSVGSGCNNQSCQINPKSTNSSQFISSADISDNSQTLKKTNESPEVCKEKEPNSKNLSVSPANKDDKNIIFTQLSSSYNEKLISEVDQMLKKNLQETSVIEHSQIEQTGDNISEDRDLNVELLITDDKIKVSENDQKDTSDQYLASIKTPRGEEPVSAKENVNQSNPIHKNSDTITPSSSSTPKTVTSLCGKFRRKSKVFLYPTASQISHTSPLMAFNFKVQDMNVLKGAVKPDTTISAQQNNKEMDFKKSIEQDLESDTRTLVHKDTELCEKFSDFQPTTDKQCEMATMYPLANKGTLESGSQFEIAVDPATNSIPVESAGKLFEGTKVASSDCQKQSVPLCKDFVYEPAQPNTTSNTISKVNNQSPVNFHQISDYQDTEIHRKTKFYRFQHTLENMESGVLKVNDCETSRIEPFKSEPNSETSRQPATLDLKAPDCSRKTECNQQINRSPEKKLSLIPDSILNQNVKEIGNTIRDSTTVQSNQEEEEVLELDLLTASQMVRWEEIDNFSEFTENDHSHLNIQHCQDEQFCHPDPGEYQDNSKSEPKVESSDLGKKGKVKEEKIQNCQNANITSKTQQHKPSYQSCDLLFTDNCNEIKEMISEEAPITQAKKEKENIEYLGNVLNNKDLYPSSSIPCLNSHDEMGKKDLECFCASDGDSVEVKDLSESEEAAKSKTIDNNDRLVIDCKTETQKMDEKVPNQTNFFHPNQVNSFSTINEVKSMQSENKIERNINTHFTNKDPQVSNIKINQNFTDQNKQRTPNLKISKRLYKGSLPFKAPRILTKGLTVKKSPLQQRDIENISAKSFEEDQILKDYNTYSEKGDKELKNIQNMGGYSTAEGKQINMKEERLKKDQSLSDDSIEAQSQSLGGFSTAKGKQISVKEESLKKAQNLFSDESIEAQSLGGFSTANGKQISVKEKSLKKAQNILCDDSIEAQSIGGFTTAKGKQISVKEESLKKAQNILTDDSIEAQSLGGFSTAKGKQISVKEESLMKAQNLLSDESIEAQSLGGFSTANRKQISVKEESLKKAQNLLSDESIEAQSLGVFSTAKGKQISVKEESLKKAQNLLSDETIEAQSLEGFSTAKGKQISVKEESLKKAQNLLSDESIKAQSLGGFSTANRKQISVKEESLKKAQNLLSDESIEAQSLGGFSTAKGKQISVKEESLKKAQNLLSDESIEAQSLGVFSTAKGKQISVKEESLKKAQNLLSDESIEAQSLGVFSTAKGKQISVKEESLKKAQNLLSDESIEAQSLGGFSTAKGKQISVKEESLKKAQNLSDESIEAQSLGVFSTAKGKQISVKEESLKKAQNLLSDESIEAQSLGGFSTAKGKQISVKEESLKKAQNLLSDESIEAQSLGGFSTAKGKQISVKEESLKKAQNLLSDESIEAQSIEGFSTAKGKQISVKEKSLKKAQNLLSDESIEAQSLGGFSTAKRKQISVKEESLKKAQNLLSDESIEAQSLGGFSTAKGKQISVKEESLKKAQNLLSDESVDISSFGGFSAAQDTKNSMEEGGLQKLRSDANVDPSVTSAKSVDSFIFQDEDVLIEIVDAMDENVVNDLLSTDFTTSQVNACHSSLNKVSIHSDITRVDLDPTYTLAKESQVANNDDHLLDDIFNCSWEDNASALPNITKNMQSSLHPLNKLKRSVSKMTSGESGCTIKKVKIDDTENGSLLSGCTKSSKQNPDFNKPCVSALLTPNTEMGKFSKSQDISDDVLMQSVKKYENQPASNSQNVSRDSKIESCFDAKDQYLNDSDCSHECEMALAVEKLESEISETFTEQPSCCINETTDHNNSGPSGYAANCPSDHPHHKFTLGKKKTCEVNSAIKSFSRETLQQENLTKSDLNKSNNNCFHVESKEKSNNNSCSDQQDSLKLSVEKFSNSFGENSINHERDSATSNIYSCFQTGLGQKVLVSKESLHKATEMLNSLPENRNQDIQPKTFAAFQTGLGKKVHVSEKALQEAVKTLNKQTHGEEHQATKETKAKTFIAFQTALGKDVPISEKSVNKAKRIFDAENEEEKNPACSNTKYQRKETPFFGAALNHKPEDRIYADSESDTNANSIPSTFKNLQHETNKINLLSQKHNSICWQPCMSTPESDRSGISPLFTDPVEIHSDQKSKKHSFSDLISWNPLDTEQSVQGKIVGKNKQDATSKKVDFKTPYCKTPVISEVQETVKVFPNINRPVFKGYRTLPNTPQKECEKYLNSNAISSVSCRNLNIVTVQSDRLKHKESCKEDQISRNFPCSTNSLSSHTASNSDNSTKISQLQESCHRNQNTNLLSTNSSVEKSSVLFPKVSDCKQLNKEISNKKVPSLVKNKVELLPNASDIRNKCSIPEIKEMPPGQFQLTDQNKMQDLSQIVPHLDSSEDNCSYKEKSSKNQENVGKNPESDKQLEPLLIESAEKLCDTESHLEEGLLEQDMIILRNKRKRILPQNGILTCRKASRKQMKFSDLLKGIKMSSFLPEQFFAYGVYPSTLAVTSANAADFRFQLSAFYNVNCLHRIIIGDGAILVPDSKSTAGKEEFFRAFQTIGGVDPKLITPQWLFNHYRWIIWKLAAYEVSLPHYFGGRCLYPEMVALQLKFRYDLEIDKCQRPALRRIIERDDSPAKRLVLCVSQIYPELNASTAPTTTSQPLKSIEVTDGWYSTKLFLDCHLSFLLSKGKLKIGQKLCISNAEIVGSDTACTPLESPESVGLKVSGNCCRPAHWDAKLGFQADPRPLCLPIIHVAADGGLVGCLDVIVTRIYPIRFMEKVPGGGSVFRSSRAESKQEQRHEVLQQEAVEKLYNKLQASFESCFPKQGPKQCKNWSQEEIRQLDNGQDLYEAMMHALQPDTFLDCLSESQLVMLADHKRLAEELKAQKMKEEFQKAISNEEHANLKRNVTPVMKVRLVGCSHIDQQQKASTILTIWRPSEDLQQLLEEGQRYRIYNVMPSPARFSYLSGLQVHLTVTRSTYFESLKTHPSIPQDLFHPRKVSSAVELHTKTVQEDHSEVDVTGIVLRMIKTVSANQRKMELLHAVDIEGNIFTLRFWGGLQIFSVNDILLEGVVFAGLNLLLQHQSSQRGASISILDACSEVSHFSLNPHQEYLRDSINQLNKLKGIQEFLVKSKEKLDSLLAEENFSLNLPKTPSTTDVCSDHLTLCKSDEARTKQRMLQQHKCAKLLTYESGPSLSPLSLQVPSTVRKAFKPPSITKSKNN